MNNISAIADDICLKKKQEVNEDMYMGIRSYMTPWRVFLYIVCGVAVAFALTCLSAGLPSAEEISKDTGQNFSCVLHLQGKRELVTQAERK